MEKNRALPEWYLEEIDSETWDDFYIDAFWDLHTCRSMGFGMGAIPWRDIAHYAKVKQLDADVTEAFIQIIKNLDVAYLNWSNEENKKGDKNG